VTLPLGGAIRRLRGSRGQVRTGRVTVAATDIQQCESAAQNARHAGPRPPGTVALMKGRHQQGDHEGNAPERHPDLKDSSGVAGEGLGVFGAHSAKPMCPPQVAP